MVNRVLAVRSTNSGSSVVSSSAVTEAMNNINADSKRRSRIQSGAKTINRGSRENAESMLFSFEETLLDLQRLTLGVREKHEERNIFCKKLKKVEKTKEDKQDGSKSIPCATVCQPSISGLQQQPNVRRRFRYQPYIRPKLKWCLLLNIRPLSVFSLAKELGDIRLDADIEEIRRLTLLTASCTKLDLSATGSCSFEATRYTSADEGMEGEVAELAEYFSQFVNVGLKMSPLAESMYA